MEKFAGIKLNDLDLQKASFRTLRNARNSFIKQYTQQLGTPQSFAVVKHLRNYIEIPKVQTLSTTEDLAVALKFIPDDTRKVTLTKDDKTVALLKNTVRTHGYNLKDIKPILNFKGDWFDSVYEISEAVRRKNLAIAFELFEQILKLDQGEPAPSVTNLPYLIGLKLACYIEILDFLLDHIGRNYLTDFYSLVEKAYYMSLKLLLDLPDLEQMEAESLLWLSGLINLSREPQKYTGTRKSARVYPE